MPATDEGRERIDAIRLEFDRFLAAEQGLAAERARRSDAAAERAVAAAAIGLGGSLLLIVVFAGYLAQAIVQPVRRAAAMAGRHAGGDLGARMPEDGVGEIGVLERSFNTMASSLEELRELSRGIHPAILSEGGLGPALKALARRSPVPVELAVDAPARLPEPVEVAAYYVVSEALGGSIRLDSPAGQGTRLQVDLPIHGGDRPSS